MKSSLIGHVGLGTVQVLIFPLILCCIGLILAAKDLDQYIKRKIGIKKLFVISSMCWLYSAVATSLIFLLHETNDVQQLNDWVIPSSELGIYLFEMVLVGIGEEFFKFLMFINVYTILHKMKVQKSYSILGGIIVSSLIFGFLHVNYNLSAWHIITLGIGLSSCVAFYFLFKYKSIIPLILAHIFQDVLVVLNHSPETEMFSLFVILCIQVIVVIGILIKIITQK